MTESQIRPLSASHPEIYQRLLDQFDYTIRHLDKPIRVCRRSLGNILLRLHGNGMKDSIIRVQLECRQHYLSFGGEDEHLHPFCYLECLSVEYRPIPRFEPRRERAWWRTGGVPAEYSWLDTCRHQILPELIDLSDDAGKEKRVGQLKNLPLASPWHTNDYGRTLTLPRACIESYLRSLEPFHLEEHYSLHYIMLRKFPGDHNMGHEEAHKEAYKRTSEHYLEHRKKNINMGTLHQTLTARDEAIIACNEPTLDFESQIEDGMDIDEQESDDEDVIWSPVSQMSGQEGFDEPQGWLQKSRKRHFGDDDDDEATHDEINKRARLTK